MTWWLHLVTLSSVSPGVATPSESARIQSLGPGCIAAQWLQGCGQEPDVRGGPTAILARGRLIPVIDYMGTECSCRDFGRLENR